MGNATHVDLCPKAPEGVGTRAEGARTGLGVVTRDTHWPHIEALTRSPSCA